MHWRQEALTYMANEGWGTSCLNPPRGAQPPPPPPSQFYWQGTGI